MNIMLDQTLELAKHACLTNFKGMYTHPFVQSLDAFQGYEYTPFAWGVEAFNVRRENVEEEQAVNKVVLIRFCPFCGEELIPQPPKPEPLPVPEPAQPKEVKGVEKGPVRADKK
jgi:hypothetical protein